MGTKAKKVLAGIAALAALALGGAALAQAGGGSDPSTPITGGPLQKAEAAALDATGGGRVTATEVRDEEGYYEVEVTRNDGSQVDVHLDRSFNPIDQSPDGGGSD